MSMMQLLSVIIVSLFNVLQMYLLVCNTKYSI